MHNHFILKIKKGEFLSSGHLKINFKNILNNGSVDKQKIWIKKYIFKIYLHSKCKQFRNENRVQLISINFLLNETFIELNSNFTQVRFCLFGFIKFIKLNSVCLVFKKKFYVYSMFEIFE